MQDNFQQFCAPDSVHRQWLDIPVQRRVPTVQTVSWSSSFLRCRSWTSPWHARYCATWCTIRVQGRRHLRRGADADSYGSSIQKNIEILQLQYIDKVIDVGFAGRAVPRCIRGWDSRAPTVALTAWTVVAMPVVVQRQLLWSRRQKTAQVPQLQYFLVVDVPVVQVHLGVQSWTRPLTCPLLSTTGFLHSGGASDTVHRLLMWTFQLCNTDGYDASSIFLYGGDEWDFDAFCVIFRAPPVVPELSASFWSPRWWRVLRHRGLPCQSASGLCRHRHPPRFSRFKTTTIIQSGEALF